MTRQNPKTYIVVVVRMANQVICQQEWKREIKIGNGNYNPFLQQRTGKDLISNDPNKKTADYYDEVFVQQDHGPFTFSIKVTPAKPAFWEVEGQFRYKGRGVGVDWVDPVHHASPESFQFGLYPDPQNDNDTIYFNVYVSMIRDSTNCALQIIHDNYSENSSVNKWSWQKQPTAVIDQWPEGSLFY